MDLSGCHLQTVRLVFAQRLYVRSCRAAGNDKGWGEIVGDTAQGYSRSLRKVAQETVGCPLDHGAALTMQRDFESRVDQKFASAQLNGRRHRHQRKYLVVLGLSQNC